MTDLQFVDIGSRECYVGMLYACYDLLRPDFVLELSWRNGLHDFTMVCINMSLRLPFTVIVVYYIGMI